MEIIGFSVLGVISGVLSGFLGIGGAIIIIPVLVYLLLKSACQFRTLGC